MAKKVSKKGVKPGVKRGPYKKNKPVIKPKKSIKNEKPIDNVNSVNNNTDINGNNDNIGSIAHTNEATPEVNLQPLEGNSTDSEKVIEPEIIEAAPEEVLNDFIEENKAPEETETIPDEIKPIETETAPEEINEDQYELKQTNYSRRDAQLINGKMLLALMDFIVPFLLLKLMGYFNSDYKQIKIKDVQLTSDQKEALKESADHVAAYIFKNVDPLTMFIISAGVMYYGNIEAAKTEYQQIKQ